MSRYRDLAETFNSRYQKPVIEELTVGFSGIDPPLKQSSGTNDHEALINLLGGDGNGHFHLTQAEIDWLRSQMSENYPPSITAGQTINLTDMQSMTPYQIQGNNTRRN